MVYTMYLVDYPYIPWHIQPSSQYPATALSAQGSIMPNPFVAIVPNPFAAIMPNPFAAIVPTPDQLSAVGVAFICRMRQQ